MTKLIATTPGLALALVIAIPAGAAPGDKMVSGANRAAPQGRPQPAGNTYAKPAGGVAKTANGMAKPASGMTKPATTSKTQFPAQTGKTAARPATTNTSTNYNRPAENSRPVTKPGGNNNVTINNNNNVNVSGNNRYPNNANRYPVYRPPGGGYYRPPNGGYYGPPRPPYGGWGGGYYPPPRYYYDDGPSVGGIIAGVAVTGTLLYLLSEATKPQQQTVYVQGSPPPMPPPPAPYVPPKNSTGAPALINVDINGLTAAQRPSASVCITEAARQIGATGGTEIRVKQIVDVEEGNGGYRFRLVLLGIYPDETRSIPMYCRATPEKIVELTFG